MWWRQKNNRHRKYEIIIYMYNNICSVHIAYSNAYTAFILYTYHMYNEKLIRRMSPSLSRKICFWLIFNGWRGGSGLEKKTGQSEWGPRRKEKGCAGVACGIMWFIVYRGECCCVTVAAVVIAVLAVHRAVGVLPGVPAIYHIHC